MKLTKKKRIKKAMVKTVTLTIKRMGNDGEGIAFYQNKPVYIYYAFLNEEVKVEIRRNKRGVYEGVLKEVITPSEHRIPVSWPYYELSGSVNLMHLNYLEALNYKRFIIKRLLERRIKDKVDLRRTVPSEKTSHYRNKTELPLIYFEGKNYPAHYQRGSNQIFKVEELIVEEESIIKAVKEVTALMDKYQINAYNFKTKRGAIASLSLRTNQKEELQITFLTKVKIDLKELVNELVGNNKKIISVYQNYVPNFKTNRDLYSGKLELIKGEKYLPIVLSGYQFYLTPFSFFQLNTLQANKIYQTIVKEGNFKKDDVVLEAYSGVGAIASFVSPYVKKVVAVEEVKAAVNDMNYSLKKNKLNNVKTITGDFKKLIKYLKTSFDKVIFDPPREGLTKVVLDYLLKTLPKEIIYLSCNPLSLIDDLKLLQEKYQIRSMTPYDFFPLTSQVESITFLKLK
ncbi:MAG: 23S rRNA (uracil(1939)-C(5))-methyltransferase RlmD [Acholeplasmataceae bacterium]|jgi:23S rRNA (uracil1939-C5)-methyltransferase|nr:23S rRNA (uracil(1939)-C(5))-methyltransferase RlmD [Acholeplasmataceae bacterium]MCK9427833.1 23S rRNA (uracil(1939)-C(5))-methyltransferase RlmD [Acholeplasmataceae bacterium]HHT38891.1 23S rRNA (uracil(1939)-C(5))-methyltransferase RlmD [Acholeplasmataceae bacterium]